MTTHNRLSGLNGLTRAALFAAFLGLVPGLPAQERPKSDELNAFESYRNGSRALDAESKDILEKVAKYYALRLTDSAVQKDGMSQHVMDFDRRLPLPPQQLYQKQNPNQRKFVEEFGKVMIAQLEPLALNQSKAIVRLNATRMASEVARAGYDGAAELFLKILDNPKESDAVKLYALKGLFNLFAIEPEKEVAPAKTVFQKKNDGQLTPLERRAIQALMTFVTRKPELAENAPLEEQDAVRFVRREAIRALGKVRVESIKNLGQIEGRPALVLLKAARGDGITPTVGAGERVEAIVGFGQLIPNKDYDLQVDYAVYHLGQALCDLAAIKNANPNDLSIPWKASAARIRDSIDKFRAVTDDMKLANAKLVKEFLEVAETQVLEPLVQGKEGSPPDVQRLRTWLTERIKLEPNSSLIKGDASTQMSLK